MSQKRTAPYQHQDGSGCWTKGCRKRQGNELEGHLNRNPPILQPAELMEVSYLAQTYVPRNLDQAHSAYYKATDKKHFGDKTQPGSKFLNPSLRKIEDILVLRMRQAGKESLTHDDREALIARGSNPNGFMKNNKYLMVLTEGTVGIQNSKDLHSDTKVEIVRTKPGAPCSLVMEVEAQPATDYAVIVLGEHEKTGRDFLITTFPGPVTKPTSHPSLDEKEGQFITVGEAREILGEDFWINTKIS